MIRAPQCAFCVHWDRETLKTCPAFPDGIPDAILEWVEHDHRLPYPGDHGIRFTPKDDLSAKFQASPFESFPPTPTPYHPAPKVDLQKMGKIVKRPDGKTYRIEVVDAPDID